MTNTKYLSMLTFVSAVLLLAGVNATDEAGTKYLEEKSKRPDVVTLPSGLRYKILEKGKGAFHPMIDSPCLCHYGAYLIDCILEQLL
jgi:FKBP-type peptidyl-prolyl cis-trans isomerase